MRDGILAHLRKIGLVPQGKGEDLKADFFELMFAEVMEDERRIQGVEEGTMASQHIVACLAKYFEQVSASKNLLNIICESIVASWMKTSKKSGKTKMQSSGLNAAGLVLKSKRANVNNNNMSKSIMTTIGKPTASGKSIMSNGNNNNSGSHQSKIS